MPRLRILVAGLFHETNTFVEDKTDLESFAIRRGDAIGATRNNGSPLGAVIELAAKLDWELLPAIDYRATPSGMVRDTVVAQFWDELKCVAKSALKQGLDAVYLILHGAMVAEEMDDVEGEILERLRLLPGIDKIPILAVLDLHANVTERMARHATYLIAYRNNPHTDAAETATRAGLLLNAAIRSGHASRIYFRQLPLAWPAPGTATAEPPMAPLEMAARRLEESGHEAVNIIAGFAYADTPDTGVSFSIVTSKGWHEAQAALDQLENIAMENMHLGYPREWNLEDALQEVCRGFYKGPALLVEPADNIGAGAPGDCTTVLRALLNHRHSSAGAILNDPAAVERLASIRIGESVSVSIGGKGSRLDPGPLELSVTLLSKTSGSFELEDPQSHLASMSGRRIEMGPCAVVSHKGLTILLTSRKTPPFDLGQWRSQGIAPEKLGVINVKAAVAHRQAYDPIAGASFTVETPGPCSSNLKLLPYRRIRRPIFPLDPIV